MVGVAEGKKVAGGGDGKEAPAQVNHPYSCHSPDLDCDKVDFASAIVAVQENTKPQMQHSAKAHHCGSVACLLAVQLDIVADTEEHRTVVLEDSAEAAKGAMNSSYLSSANPCLSSATNPCLSSYPEGLGKDNLQVEEVEVEWERPLP